LEKSRLPHFFRTSVAFPERKRRDFLRGPLPHFGSVNRSYRPPLEQRKNASSMTLAPTVPWAGSAPVRQKSNNNYMNDTFLIDGFVKACLCSNRLIKLKLSETSRPRRFHLRRGSAAITNSCHEAALAQG